MATWTTPSTWVNGAQVAATFNAQIRDNLTWLKGAFTQLNVTSDSAKAKITPALVGARVTKAANLSVVTATATPHPFDSETGGFDSDAFHDNASNNTRLTIPADFGGYYIVGAQIQFAANATGYRQVTVKLNGTTFLAAQALPAVATSVDARITTCNLHLLAATDYVEAEVTQTSGGNLNSEVATAYAPWFWLHRLSSS